MGTVQKIVESLIRISDDKKGQLTNRYTEHSAWMRSELDIIRQLIKKNPRDDHKANDENIPPVQPNFLSSSSNRSSSEKNEEESAMRVKRKSPEADILGSRNSPDLKRNSNQDHDELATSAGLPTDLNRLKKEQLLEELESRGNTVFTMKSLKKDLVDALKDELIKCSKDAEAVVLDNEVEVEPSALEAMDLVFSPLKAAAVTDDNNDKNNNNDNNNSSDNGGKNSTQIEIKSPVASVFVPSSPVPSSQSK